jgi:hypothetical protein
MTNQKAGMLITLTHQMTIPQTNFRMGYFISDHYSLAGVDHMKYVLTQNQTVEFREPLQQEHHMMGFIPMIQ